jgi:choice-of-anchor C domain-containing protein
VLPLVLIAGGAALAVAVGVTVLVLALSRQRKDQSPDATSGGKPAVGPTGKWPPPGPARWVAPAGDLVANGSFEEGPEPDPTGPGFTPFEAGSTAIPGWAVTRGSVDYIGPYWQHADGRRSIDLNGNEPGAVAQTLRTTPGRSYKVTFALAGNNCGDGPSVKTLVVTAGGARAEFTFDAAGKTYADMGWVTHTWEFTAEAAETTLEFASTTEQPAACGPALDRVSVVEAGP